MSKGDPWLEEELTAARNAVRATDDYKTGCIAADKICEAVTVLNSAIRAAAKYGVSTDLKVCPMRSIDSEVDYYIVECRDIHRSQSFIDAPWSGLSDK